jgi:hypothetical protein
MLTAYRLMFPKVAPRGAIGGMKKEPSGPLGLTATRGLLMGSQEGQWSAAASAASDNVVPFGARRTSVKAHTSTSFDGFSDAELGRAELAAEVAADRHEKAIVVRFDQAKATSRFGSDRMADMAALLPLYDASDATLRMLAAIRAERARRCRPRGTAASEQSAAGGTGSV